jgi:glycosyltransferase involved in cell wall biosynthesis
MRLCLVAHGFPPLERSGVENYTAQLARGLAAAGEDVAVFVPRVRSDLPDLSLRYEARDGYGIHWFTGNSQPGDPAEQLDPPGRAAQFDAFLERERPQLVHFQHVAKLGLGLVEVARARGLPLVYTAHDYYPVCHRITWMRPDLARCEVLGEPRACSRCDLALGLLNQLPELGDYHIGAFPAALPPDTRRRLEAILAGDERGSGLAAEEWAAAAQRRAELDLRRREVFGLFDRILCPTHFLAERLVEGGLSRSVLQHLPYGIDTAQLAALPRPTAAELRSRPLRIGFLGSATKHKGLHVLLDAWALLQPRGSAELHLWGDSTDRPYVEQCRRRAEALGAHWHGPFDQRDLASCLGRVDLLVVPSIWVENYPLAIREALAAGRPVVASRVGALPESIADGRDGRLFLPGDGADLARVLGELIAAPEDVVRLRAGAAPVHDLAAHVREHRALYAELSAPRPEAEAAPVLPHLRQLAARHREINSLPSAELFERTVTGLDGLARRLGVPAAAPGALLAQALARQNSTQERLRDRETERSYLRGELDRHGAVEDELRRHARWRAEQVVGLELAVAALERERDWRADTAANLQQTVDSLERERDWRAQSAEAWERRAAELEAELTARSAEWKGRAVEVEALLLEQQEAQARERELRESRDAAAADSARLAGELAALRADHDQRRQRLAEVQAELLRADGERAWRAEEMASAEARLRSVRGGLLPARWALQQHLQRWERASRDEGWEPPRDGSGGRDR